MTEEGISAVRTMLAQDFEAKAEWREAMADRYPEDERNERAAQGLRSLAAYVSALPDADPRLHAINAAWNNESYDLETLDMMLSRYGFGPGSSRGPLDDDTFFTWYAEEWSRQPGLESIYKEDPARVRNLIATDPLANDVIAVEHRNSGLEEFRRLLSDSEYFDRRMPQGRGPEAVWQNFLEDNRWILGGSLAGQFLIPFDETRLEQIVVGASIAGVGKSVDALLRTDGLVHSMVFVEIKHHRTKLLASEEYRSGCWSPSKELSGRVAQVQGAVQRAMVKIRLAESASDGSEIPGIFTYLFRPRSFLIVGSLGELFGETGGIIPDKYQSFELYRRHLQEPEIVTFDELLARAEQLVNVANA